MSVITSISPQRNGKRINIYLDGKFGFGIDLKNFVKLGLKVERRLSDEELKTILFKSSSQKYFDGSLLFISLRPRSIKEVSDWCVRKKLSKDDSLKLIDKLKKMKLLDDESFAKWWIGQRISFKNKSKKELVSELRHKGIDRKFIDGVLEDLPVDDEKNARQLLLKNSYKWKNYPRKTALQKMYGYLLRKGFNWEVVKKVTNSFLDI